MSAGQDVRRVAAMRLGALGPSGAFIGDPARPASLARITLCADDFAHSRGTSEVIVNLAHARRINAISCMAVRPGWRSDAQLLSGLRRDCEIGLNLVLTDDRPLTAMPRYAPSGRMPSAERLHHLAMNERLLGELAVEVTRQFDAFSQAIGRPPDFVTSQGHVHHFPVIREMILEEAAWRAPAAWMLSSSDGLGALLSRPCRRRAMVSSWRSRGYSAVAKSFGLSTNRSFAGHYDFSMDFADVFPRFFDRASEHHVIVVHPGADDRADDPIVEVRLREAAFLERCRLPSAVAATPAQFRAQ